MKYCTSGTVIIFAGQVPNCEQCHECFFQWDDVINDLRQGITDLQLRISNLTETYFNNTDENDIQMEINLLLTDLQEANDSLNTITLQESSVDELQQMIINVSVTRIGVMNSLIIIMAVINN